MKTRQLTELQSLGTTEYDILWTVELDDANYLTDFPCRDTQIWTDSRRLDDLEAFAVLSGLGYVHDDVTLSNYGRSHLNDLLAEKESNK